MDLKQIDTVLETARSANFRRAAESLGISQPALSHRIRSLEDEVGFTIFTRTARGAVPTPAGEQFLASLRRIRIDISTAVQLGQNFAHRYARSLSLGVKWRSALLALPSVIETMRALHPDTDVSPVFLTDESLDRFFSGEIDLAFTRQDTSRLSDVEAHPLYESQIKLVVRPDDPLAGRDLVRPEDLKGRRLMVGGTSPVPLRSIQRRLIEEFGLEHFNSPDHDTTIVSVAAGKGVCLSLGLFDDGSPGVAWVPFACEETIPCSLLTHAGDHRPELEDLVRLLRNAYAPGSAWAKRV